MDLLEPEPGLVLDDPAWPLRTYGTQRLPARIDASLVSPGCRDRATFCLEPGGRGDS